MMTNSIQQVVTNAATGTDMISSAIRAVGDWPPELVFVAGMAMAAKVLKATPRVNNDYIPHILGVFGIISYCGLLGWTWRNGIIGFSVGSMAIHLHQILKPWLKRYFGVPTGDTVEIKKSDVPPPSQ